MYRASRESQVNWRKEKKRKGKKQVGWKIFACMGKARIHDNKLKSFGKEF